MEEIVFSFYFIILFVFRGCHILSISRSPKFSWFVYLPSSSSFPRPWGLPQSAPECVKQEGRAQGDNTNIGNFTSRTCGPEAEDVSGNHPPCTFQRLSLHSQTATEQKTPKCGSWATQGTKSTYNNLHQLKVLGYFVVVSF